jgi:hypothetical protein
MWRCPKCGEQIEDQFDSCWKCVEPLPLQPERRTQLPVSGGVFRYWSRGWLVLLLTVLVGVCVRFASYVFSGAVAYSHEVTSGGRPSGAAVLLPLLVLAMAVVTIPVCAYLAFAIFFGEKAWPESSIPSREETAFALFKEGARLEARGKVQDALDAYSEVVEDYPETPAAQDARKSIESLRAQIQ